MTVTIDIAILLICFSPLDRLALALSVLCAVRAVLFGYFQAGNLVDRSFFLSREG